jgi:hypothetical protein
MQREIILKPTSTVTGYTTCVDPNTSPYPWLGTGSMTVHAIWAQNGTSAVNTPGTSAVGSAYAYCWPDAWAPYHVVGYSGGPTLARFTKVSFSTRFDYSQSGPNNWYGSGGSPSLGPGLKIGLRNRAGNAYHYSSSVYVGDNNSPVGDLSDWDAYNSRPSEAMAWALTPMYTWELLSHPDGGPFTLEDINNMAAGLFFFWWGPTGVAQGSPAYDNSQGSFFKIRVPNFVCTLTVEDLGGFVSNMRCASSNTIRLYRRARNTITPKTFVHRAPAGLGETLYLTHPRGPDVTGAGWGERRLERHGATVLKRTYEPESFMVSDEAFDLRAYSCLGWAAYRIDCAWNPELQGLSLIEKGNSFTHTRSDDAWSPRPGDGRLMRVLEDYPNISFHGLACQGGDDVSILKRNYDCHQSGWATVSNTGDFTTSQDTDVSMVEEAGYLSSSLLDYGAGGATGGREKSFGAVVANTRLHVRIILKNTRMDDPANEFGEWYLKYTEPGGTFYWDEANRDWANTATYNPVPSQNADGDPIVFGETVADSIPIYANGNCSVAVGRFSSQVGPVQIHAALVDVQKTDLTVAGARTPSVLLDTELTRTADFHKMTHVYGRELWMYDRGVAMAEFQPFWRAEDLPEDAVKPILHAQHFTNTYDAIQFIPKDTTDLLRFERAMPGLTTFQLDCPIVDANGDPLELNRSHVVRTWARWLDSEGWNEFGPYSVQIGYMVSYESNGALVATGTALGTLSTEYQTLSNYNQWVARYNRAYVGIGCDESDRCLDGYMRTWETRRNPLHGLEAIWRL